MYQDSLYGSPRHPRKWMFHPRKRRILPPLMSVMAAVWVIFEVVNRF